MSAGVFEGLSPGELQKRMAKTAGIKIGKKPEHIKIKALKNIDLVVIVANDVLKHYFCIRENICRKS